MNLQMPGAAFPNVYHFQPGAVNVGGVSKALPVGNGGGYTGPFANYSFLGQPFSFYLGAVLLLFLLKFLNEHDRSPVSREVSGIHIGAANVATITVAAAIGFASLKVLFTRWTVPGLSEFVNYI